jgi:RND family efflux transporter MFP subunit
MSHAPDARIAPQRSVSAASWGTRLLAALVALTLGCGRGKGDARPPPPAKIDKPQKEIDVNSIVLTPEAEARLGLKTAPVEKRRVQRARYLGGEAVVPPGLSVTVAAPLSGSLSVAGDVTPRPGAALAKGQAIFSLSLTSADRIKVAESKTNVAAARIEADAAVAKAKIDLDAARIALDRAESMAREQVGSTKQLDEARAAASLAVASLAAAEARRAALVHTTAEAGTTSPISIESPMAGVLSRLFVQPGQVVAAGAPLFEVARYETMWIRVPIYVGDVAAIDADKEALIGTLTGAADPGSIVARPVAAPPSANPTAATVDLFYELGNASGTLRPGQCVSATLPLRAEAESLVVPWPAVVHDIHGGAWVYEATAARTYARRRVQVRHVVSGAAALASGPKVGAAVVVEGAAELFGAEFGTGK